MKTKFIILVSLVVLIIMCLTACYKSSGEEITDGNTSETTEELTSAICINGKVEETVEVNTNFEDPGVSLPEGYTVVVLGEINTGRLGRQKITYNIYHNSGELIKELHRYVNVVDTTAPVYTVVDDDESNYYVGVEYELSDFIVDYTDNYNDRDDIIVSTSNFIFSSQGNHKVEIEFTDKSGNTTVFTREITVTLDIWKLIEETYKDRPNRIHSDTNGIGHKYIRVQIDDNTSMSYYDSGSLHYLKQVDSNLGYYASIQISADYGDFRNANVTYHISKYGSSYSVGFATIDATQTSVNIAKFDHTINDLNLDESEMLVELNANISFVLDEFHEYMNNILHLEIQ